MGEIHLYSYPTSPYGQKVGCYLKYKRLDYRFIGVSPLDNEQIKFTGQRQVPVLKIGDEWRKESSELGFWLDELFPKRRIIPSDIARAKKVREVDDWVSRALIPAMFRGVVEWQSSFNSITNGWRLAQTVNNITPLPFYVRMIWPFAIRRAPFIVRMVAQLDLNEPMSHMMLRLEQEFVNHLNGQDYLGGRSEVSLADLSAFPIIVNAYMTGMRSKHFLIDRPEIRAWAERLAQQLPANPLLVPDSFIKRPLL